MIKTQTNLTSFTTPAEAREWAFENLTSVYAASRTGNQSAMSVRMAVANCIAAAFVGKDEASAESWLLAAVNQYRRERVESEKTS